MPRSLERDGQLTLVAGTRAGLAPWLDLGALGQVAAEAVDLLVIDLDRLVGAEGADLATASIAIEVVALLGSDRGRHTSGISWSEGKVVDVGVVGRGSAATGWGAR